MTGRSIYPRLREPLRTIALAAVDEQTDLAERVSLVEAIEGVKPSFVAFLDLRERQGAFAALAEAVGDAAATGMVNASVHHRYRPFRIDDLAMAAIVESRAGYRQDVFWLTRDPPLAAAYGSGSPSDIPDDALLGYPSCCAQWHYDVFFARGIEAFCAVAACEARDRMLDYLRREWEPMSGFYLPEELYLAAVLRSNWRYPYIDHMACAACVAVPDSPSARLDARRSALGASLEPGLHADVGRWAAAQDRRWRDLLGRSGQVIRRAASEGCATVRGADVYARHARHLVRAIAG